MNSVSENQVISSLNLFYFFAYIILADGSELNLKFKNELGIIKQANSTY